jgi:acetyltransferase
VLHVRPIRPEDAELERTFVNGLSEQSRYFRFFYRLHELTPAMLARFTQVDYDREMALIAIDDGVAARAGKQEPPSPARGDADRAGGRKEADARPPQGGPVEETSGTPRAIVGVARYTANPDGESAEFAIVVADAWQGRGVGRMLMQRLIDCAKRRGLSRLEGAVLRANADMRRFCEGLGFATHDDPNEPEQVTMSLDLT